MKKILVCIFATLMLSIPVCAAEIDMASMSLDDLVSLRSQITEEINTRLSDAAGPIATGIYEVGKDIKEGTYYLSGVSKSEGELYFKIFLYENKDAFDNGEELSRESDSCFIDNGEDATVNLHDGMFMVIEGGKAVIQAMEPAWAP